MAASVVVGCDRHEVGAAVAGLGEVVVVGDPGVARVRVPHQHQLGVEVVVHAAGARELAEGEVLADWEVVDEAVGVEGDPTEQACEAKERRLGHQTALDGLFEDDRLGSFEIDGLHECLGDLAERLIQEMRSHSPDPRSPSRAKRMGDAILAAQLRAPAGTLLAAEGVHVGYAGLDHRDRPAGLFEGDLAVAHIDPVGTRGHAVEAMRAPLDVVPGPAAPVRGLGGSRIVSGRIVSGRVVGGAHRGTFNPSAGLRRQRRSPHASGYPAASPRRHRLRVGLPIHPVLPFEIRHTVLLVGGAAAVGEEGLSHAISSPLRQ